MQLNGFFSAEGHPLFKVRLNGLDEPITALLDTGFSGDLMVPEPVPAVAALKLTGFEECVLANGETLFARIYEGSIEWLGETKPIDILCMSGVAPLLGMGILQNCRLVMAPARQTLLIEG